ncbi:MAG: heparan-alpha-glucosaminide N-acetyltransferase domain-containing protein [Bacteroidales bacterium]|nr:heparan-alpha-glucosaminide N-acetyltransferase domain-containing protein [Bacteroidales bacterium]
MDKVVTNRYTALDVLRGMTIAGMILVNNPGTWGKIFPPLKHAAWHGCTPTDLVFPFFLFIVGAALSFAFAKYNDTLNKESVKKVIKRSFLIFLTGLLLNAFPFYNTSPSPELSFGENWLVYIQNLRIFGVLQRIALCYMVGALVALWLQKPKKIIVAGSVLMLLHLLILVIFGTGDPFSKEGTIAGSIDVALVGITHVYKGFGMPFDPEGLLGVLSGSATVLFGYLVGGHIRKSANKTEAVGDLYSIGLIALGVGVVLSTVIPINKPLWTPSYVFYAGGWSVLMLALFIYFIDIKGKEKIFYPFKALGLNPLFAFVMAGVFAKTLGRIIKWQTSVLQDDGTFKEITTNASSWIYQNCCVPLLGNNEWGSLLYALGYVTIFTTMAIILYKKKIVIKL